MSEYSIYEDHPNYRVPDEREINVVKRIKELSNKQYNKVEDDSIEEGELKNAINKLSSGLNSMNTNISTMTTKIGTVTPGHTVCGDIATINTTLGTLSQTVTRLSNRPKILKAPDVSLTSTTQISTSDLYTALRTNMSKGDILVDEFNLSDGPSGLSAESLQHVGILAYCTADNVTDGDSTYSRAYMIASSKTTSDIWNCQLIDGTYTWVKISA